MIENRFGDRVAIETADGHGVTYDELFSRARGFATRDIVEVPAERSVDFVARCLGAWLGGGAFVPVDPGDPRPRPRIDATGLAYAITTSGSTGTPKLVMVGPRGVPALLRTQIDAFALGPGARVLWLHAPVFDASISDWATALASGATLVLPTAEAFAGGLTDELAARAITHVDLPPSLLPALEPPPGLRVVVLGGEACDVERVRTLARGLRVVIVYGPTEATVCSSLVVVDPDRWERPLIGHPLPGVGYRVIDGELYIAGDGLAVGYASDPAETARRFVERDGIRLYRTGDRVEPTPHGLAFVGRVDRQRKIAGRRIELDEIEAAIRSHRIECAVVARGDRIIAFAETAFDRAALALPRYMRPSRVVVMPLPRTSTGKLDRGALERFELPAPDVAFTDPLERELALLWCQALGTAGVEMTDRFSDAGGDSLARMMFEPGLVDGDPTFAEVVARARTARVHVRVRDLPVRAIPIEPIARRGDAILVTGAAGFLGRELVRRLPNVIGLVHETAIDGIETVRGDLARPYFGLSPAAWRALAERIGAVVHCAATIRLGGSWDEHAGANVDGTIEALRIAHGLPFHYISTLSVFAGTDRARGRHAPESAPDPDAIVYGGYAQTKIAAEAIVRRRTGATTIFRLGLLAPETYRPRDQLPMTIRGLVKLGAVPAGFDDDCFDVTPVAAAADAIVARMAHPGIHHVAAVRATSCRELRDALRLPAIAAATWRERARARLDDADVAMAYASFSRRPELELVRATGADFGGTLTATIDLARLA